jgi:Flp pilus assembly pilin Flp
VPIAIHIAYQYVIDILAEIHHMHVANSKGAQLTIWRTDVATSVVSVIALLRMLDDAVSATRLLAVIAAPIILHLVSVVADLSGVYDPIATTLEAAVLPTRSALFIAVTVPFIALLIQALHDPITADRSIEGR